MLHRLSSPQRCGKNCRHQWHISYDGHSTVTFERSGIMGGDRKTVKVELGYDAEVEIRLWQANPTATVGADGAAYITFPNHPLSGLKYRPPKR